MPEQLEIAEAVEGETRVLRVRGELDIATARLLDTRLRELLADHRRIVLDLAELSFMDSSGLAVLITAARAAAGNGGGFALRDVSATVMRVLELSGVAAKLELLPPDQLSAPGG